MGGADWPSESLSDTPVLCQQTGGKPGVTFTSAKGEVFSVLEWAPGRAASSWAEPPSPPFLLGGVVFLSTSLSLCFRHTLL